MKLNLRLRGAQNAKPERSKRKRHVINNTFRCTKETTTERDSKRERMNLVLERRKPKQERKTQKRRIYGGVRLNVVPGFCIKGDAENGYQC